MLPHGVFVCIDCAQLHRSLGRHISQTKAINTGTYLWFPAEIGVMQAVGNAVADRAFAALPPKPSRDASPAEKLAYVTKKYVTPVDWARAATSACPPTPSSHPFLPPVSLPPQSPAAIPQGGAKAGRQTRPLPGARRGQPDKDLISFADEVTFAPAAVAANAIPHLSEPASSAQDSNTWEPFRSPCTLGADQPSRQHEAVKADILSRFSHAAVQPGAFFAQYGL